MASMPWKIMHDLLLQLEQGYDPSHLVFFLWQKSQASLAVRRLTGASRAFLGVSWDT